MVINVTQNEIYNVMHSIIINKMRISNVLIIGLAILHFLLLSIIIFPVIFYVALELTLICKTKTDEESHEENKPFIKEDVF